MSGVSALFFNILVLLLVVLSLFNNVFGEVVPMSAVLIEARRGY